MFTSFNQFDNRFKNLGKFSADRSACPIFSLITAHNFMKDGLSDKTRHEKNVCSAVFNYSANDAIPKNKFSVIR